MPKSSQLTRLIPFNIGKKLKIKNTDSTNMPESSQLMRLIPTSIGKKLKNKNTDSTNA